MKRRRREAWNKLWKSQMSGVIKGGRVSLYDVGSECLAPVNLRKSFKTLLENKVIFCFLSAYFFTAPRNTTFPFVVAFPWRNFQFLSLQFYIQPSRRIVLTSHRKEEAVGESHKVLEFMWNINYTSSRHDQFCVTSASWNINHDH